MVDNILINQSYSIITKCNLCNNNIQNCVCNTCNICNNNNNIQNCICKTCNICNNNIQNCTCNKICNICNNNVQNCICNNDPCNISYTDIYTSWEYIIVIGVLLLIYIPIFISYFFGINSTWYENLKKDIANTWIIAGLWIVVIIISYIGLYILWRNPTPEIIARNLIITVLFFLGNVILLAWSVIFYQFQNISTATWIALVLFIFEFWIFIYVWNVDRLAGILLLPLVGMYLYFFYSMVHLAFINDVML